MAIIQPRSERAKRLARLRGDIRRARRNYRRINRKCRRLDRRVQLYHRRKPVSTKTRRLRPYDPRVKDESIETMLYDAKALRNGARRDYETARMVYMFNLKRPR